MFDWLNTPISMPFWFVIVWVLVSDLVRAGLDWLADRIFPHDDDDDDDDGGGFLVEARKYE